MAKVVIYGDTVDVAINVSDKKAEEIYNYLKTILSNLND